MAYRSFEELAVWREAVELAVDIYAKLESCRDFGLRDQMSRAAVSIPSNVAEGAERGSNPDFIRFLHIAKGSAAELRTQLIIATRIGLIGSDDQVVLDDRIKKISSQLQNLIAALKRKT